MCLRILYLESLAVRRRRAIKFIFNARPTRMALRFRFCSHARTRNTINVLARIFLRSTWCQNHFWIWRCFVSRNNVTNRFLPWIPRQRHWMRVAARARRLCMTNRLANCRRTKHCMRKAAR